MQYASSIAVSHTKDEVTARVNMPGYKPSTLKLTVRGTLDGYTVVSGTAAKSTEDNAKKTEIALLLDIDPRSVALSHARAKLEDGVLKLTLPVNPAIKEREVQIEQ